MGAPPQVVGLQIVELLDLAVRAGVEAALVLARTRLEGPLHLGLRKRQLRHSHAVDSFVHFFAKI